MASSRTIVIHLSVQVPDDDQRTDDQIADAVIAAVEVGQDDDSVRDLVVANH